MSEHSSLPFDPIDFGSLLFGGSLRQILCCSCFVGMVDVVATRRLGSNVMAEERSIDGVTIRS